MDHGGYIMKLKRDNPRGKNNQGYVREHILVMEEYLSILFDETVYIPRGYNIHHINKNRSDNSLINLEIMSSSEHTTHHMIGNTIPLGKHIDTSNRICHNCGSNTTWIQHPTPRSREKTSFPHWYHYRTDKTKWLCRKCYKRELKANI